MQHTKAGLNIFLVSPHLPVMKTTLLFPLGSTIHGDLDTIFFWAATEKEIVT